MAFFQDIKIKMDDTNYEMKHKLRVTIEHMKEVPEVKNASMHFGSDISLDNIMFTCFLSCLVCPSLWTGGFGSY